MFSSRINILPETPPVGYLFRLQDVEKQRERRKTKAKKAERRKKKKLGNMKKTPQICGGVSGHFRKRPIVPNFWCPNFGAFSPPLVAEIDKGRGAKKHKIRDTKN